MTVAAPSTNGHAKREEEVPRDIASEDALLGSLLLDAGQCEPVAKIVGEQDFFAAENRRLYRAIRQTFEETSATDVTLIRNCLDEAGDLSRIGRHDTNESGIARLIELVNARPTAANATYYAEAVAKAAARRRLLLQADRLRRLAMSPTSRDLEQLKADAMEIAAGFEPASTAKADPPRFLSLLTSGELASAATQQPYLISRILPKGQPGTIGALAKSLKTRIAADLVFSLGTGTPFLGRFEVPEPVNVAFLSAESGQHANQQQLLAVARDRGIDPADARVLWGFSLPQLARSSDLDALEKLITDRELAAIVLDPSYLCLLGADTQNRQASNLFDMGSLLIPLSEIGQRTGSTVCLVHHFRKTIEPYQQPELSDLSMSGFAEWSRWWLLLARQERYEHDGRHKLWMAAGGSNGRSGSWSVLVDEGQPDDRRWHVEVSTASNARDEADKEAERKRAAQQEAREAGYRQRLESAMKLHPDGDTAKALRDESGLNAQNFATAIQTLLRDGLAEACTVTKLGKAYDGYRPRNPHPNKGNGTSGTERDSERKYRRDGDRDKGPL